MNELDNQMQYVNGQCQKLKEDTNYLALSSHSIAELVEPSKTVEKHLDESTKIMGDMARDAFYMLDNQVVINCLQNAIGAHKNWLKTLKDIAQSENQKCCKQTVQNAGLGTFTMQ